MPAWMTPLLWVLVSCPRRGWRSRTQTETPRAAIARAEARPVTPAPMTATSMRVTFLALARSWSIPDRGVVEVREHQVVEDEGVGVDRVRDSRQRLRRLVQ